LVRLWIDGDRVIETVGEGDIEGLIIGNDKVGDNEAVIEEVGDIDIVLLIEALDDSDMVGVVDVDEVKVDERDGEDDEERDEE